MRPPSGWRCLSILSIVIAPLAWAEPPTFPGIPTARTVNVRTDFGAKANGITDDTKAIQNAIDFVAAQGGGTVYFPAGIYMVNTLADTQDNLLPVTQPGLYGPNGYTHQIMMRSRVRLLGEGGRASVLKMPAGSRTDPLDRAARRNRAMVVMGDATFSEQNPDRWQEDIEIAHLGFDLDNGIGRRALQIRNPARNVRIHHCEGFQSDLERGAAPVDGLAYDNHFFNMASNGFPVEGPRQASRVDIPENVTVDHCVVRGLIQLTSDGGAGTRNLWIHHNLVENALSFGIAVTTTGPCNALFEDIVIEDNTIESPSGAGILVGENYIGADMDFAAIKIHALRRVTIRRNTIRVRSTPSAGVAWSGWGADAAGIMLISALLETKGCRIEDNVLSAENRPAIPTSRQALRIASWDLNWLPTYQHGHGGAMPTLDAAAFDPSASAITLERHGLIDGMQVQLKPLGASALPSGLEPYRIYRIVRIDRDRFALTNLPGSPRLMFGRPATAASCEVLMTPSLENFVIARNRLEGSWDWDAAIWGATANLLIDGNEFCSRFTIDGSHDNVNFVHNRSTGTLALRDCTLRRAKFSENSWSLDERTSGRQFGPGIITISGPTDAWRHVEATFEKNTFSFTPASFERDRMFSAVWMNRSDWRPPSWPGWQGAAALHLESNRIANPAVLGWGIEPQFVTGWAGNEGLNAWGKINETPPAKNATIEPAAPEGEAANASGGLVVPDTSSSKLSAFSVRTTAGSASRTLVVGFGISGEERKRFLIRGVGPGLGVFGITDASTDPQIRLYAGSVDTVGNDDWSSAPDVASIVSSTARAGAFPLLTASRDAALLESLPGGSYAVHCTDALGAARIVLVEVFDTDLSSRSRLSSLSARSQVGTGDSILISGFVVHGNGTKRVLIRAIGPSLAQFGVSGVLSDPAAELHAHVEGKDTVLASNGDWGGGSVLSDAFAQTGAFPLDKRTRDAALVATLPPGAYTVHVSGVNNSTGVALVEIYEIP